MACLKIPTTNINRAKVKEAWNEPLDDTSPCGPSSLGMHYHDNAMFDNSFFELTMDGNIVMSPLFGPSSFDQEADDPYP